MDSKEAAETVFSARHDVITVQVHILQGTGSAPARDVRPYRCNFDHGENQLYMFKTLHAPDSSEILMDQGFSICTARIEDCGNFPMHLILFPV